MTSIFKCVLMQLHVYVTGPQLSILWYIIVHIVFVAGYGWIKLPLYTFVYTV